MEYCWPVFRKHLEILTQDKVWNSEHKFQQDVVENARQRLTRRAKGWFSHRKVLKEDNQSDPDFQKALEEFETKHFGAYRRWRRNSNAPGKKLEDQAHDLNERIKQLFLFYLTYGEVHDFRNNKHILNLFFNTVVMRFYEKETNPPLGEWIRLQGHKLYKLFYVVYYKDEMNRFGFHHDDLDDLCMAPWFVKRFYEKEADWHQVFNLAEDFKSINQMCQLETPVFLKYWSKTLIGGLKPEEKEAREKWMQTFKADFPKPAQEELDEILKSFDESAQQSLLLKLQQADSDKNKAQADFGGLTERGRATASDFVTEDHRNLFKQAFTQLETAKQLLTTAEAVQKEGETALNKAQVADFREKEASEKDFKQAFIKLDEALKDFKEADAGLSAAIGSFSNLFTEAKSNAGVKSYLFEAKALQKKAAWAVLNMDYKIQKGQFTKIIQHGFEDAITSERQKFAKKYKTFYEAAGGLLGLSGYFTVCRHYSDVVYLHLFLLFPLAWLYFEWHNTIENNDWLSLVSMSGLFDVERNILLMAGLTIAFILIAVTIFCFCNLRTRGGSSAPRRDKGTGVYWNMSARIQVFLLWLFVLGTELVLMKFLVLTPIRNATEDYIVQFFDNPAKNTILLIIHWVPVVVLYFSSIQYIFTLWVGIFGWIYGMKDRVYNTTTWSQVVNAFYIDEKKEAKNAKKQVSEDGEKTRPPIYVPRVVDMFWKTMMPKECQESYKVLDSEKPDEFGLQGEEREKNRKIIAFARIWNEIIQYFYGIHKLSKEEVQKYSYQITYSAKGDYLDGKIEQTPHLKEEPKTEEVAYHLIRFVNNVNMTNKPNLYTVRQMIPLTVLTPVGNEKIIYPYEDVTRVDNTQSSFLAHLIHKLPHEWTNFKKREAISEKAKDFVDRLEKDLEQGLQPDQKTKSRWIHSHKDGIALKNKLCEWASLRFQALYRTVNGFMQIPVALAILARIQEPKLSQEEAERIVSDKFSYVIGYQSFGDYLNSYEKSRKKAENGEDLTAGEAEAHYAVYNIQYIQKQYPKVRFVYPSKEGDVYKSNLIMGEDPIEHFGYKITLYGPFIELGLGKPTHQNMLSQYIDGLAIQTIDINQDSVISQSFFIPNVLAEFDKDPRVKIIGLPEFVLTTDWSGTAWCSAFSEHTFGTLVQRVYGKIAIRLHYGHPDIHDAMWVMTETGLSKLTYVSEDIFTGFDCIIKGGKDIHAEYHEVGKARDVDLYTTTKFTRKISMGGAQMACTRYIWYLQSSSNTSFFQRLSYYYSTVGFYLNHLMLYMSIWFAIISQLLLIIIDKYILRDDISSFMVERVFSFQVGFALIAPGVLQLTLESGVVLGVWKYLSHFGILAVYATFHILNTSSYWQFGLTKPSFYLPSGRGTGLEHYFMKEMYEAFYPTHWKPGFIIFWMGIVALILSGNWLLFLFMFLLPSAIWLWGAMFLNPGALPSTVHEEQWKRLVNRDMEQTNAIILQHVKWNDFDPDEERSFFLKRWAKSIKKSVHLVYTAVNFALQTRVLRLLAIVVIVWEWAFSSKIPTYLFTDERRRVLRWDEENVRQKSIFYSQMATAHSESHEIPDRKPEPTSADLKRPEAAPAQVKLQSPPGSRTSEPKKVKITEPEEQQQPQPQQVLRTSDSKKVRTSGEVTEQPTTTKQPKNSQPEEKISPKQVKIVEPDEEGVAPLTRLRSNEQLEGSIPKRGGMKKKMSILNIPGERERLEARGIETSLEKKPRKSVQWKEEDKDE